MLRVRVSAGLTVLILCVVALAARTPAAAQVPPAAPGQSPPPGPPPKPKNLRVLDREIDHDSLIAIMRIWSNALGVRCTHCHVGQDGDLRSMDFASDKKDEKKAAREMLRMTATINSDYIDRVTGNDHHYPHDPKVRVPDLGDGAVHCLTCHRGQQKPPRPLDAILSETVVKEGVDAAIAKYKQLRSESLEAGIYDFRDMTLLSVVRSLREQKRIDQSLAFAKASVDLFPNSSNAAVALGVALFDSGDRAAAKAQFDRALQLDPNNGMAQQGLKRLEAP